MWLGLTLVMTININGEYTDAEIKTDCVDDTTIEQVQKLVNHEAFTNPVKVMPDAHAGAGAVIGFTMEMGDKVCPNTVGVDIGCGVRAERLNKKVTPRDFVKAVNKVVPMGKNVRGEPLCVANSNIEEICDKIGYSVDRALKSIGTLGGGNHFIELNEDSEGQQWITVHSGSRGFGFNISKYHQDRAIEYQKELNEDAFTAEELHYLTDGKVDYEKIREDYDGGKIEEIGNALTEKVLAETTVEDDDLAFLEGEDLREYVYDMSVAKDYAEVNRASMLRLIVDELGVETEYTIDSPHNFIDKFNIIRKGATPAREGQEGIVPFNMAEGCIIIEGKGDEDWNESAPHGAGRSMSRTVAKKQLTVNDFAKDMEGVFSVNINHDTLDEAPRAYKDTSIIKERIKESAKITDILKSVANVKA